MRAALLLFSLALACDPLPRSGAAPPVNKTRVPPPIQGAPDYCVDSDVVDVWAVDCVARCIPREEYKILCHTGGPPHVFLADPMARPQSEWARVPDEPIYDCTKSAAWRVFAAKFDPRDWGELDVMYVASWVGSSVGECLRAAPRTAEKEYFKTHWDRPYYTITEAIPTE